MLITFDPTSINPKEMTHNIEICFEYKMFFHHFIKRLLYNSSKLAIQ